MKCGYGNNCKHGGEVEKEESIKVSTKYWHKDCYDEKNGKIEIEKYWIDNYPECVLMMLRKAIKDNVTSFGWEYVLWVLKWIKNNKKPLSNPMGVKRYCVDNRLQEEYEKSKLKEQYIKMKEEKIEFENKTVKFEYKPNKKKITDLI